MQLTPFTKEDMELFEKLRKEGGKLTILDRIPDVSQEDAFVQAMRHHYEYIYNGSSILINGDYLIEFYHGTTVTVTRLVPLRTREVTVDKAIRQLINACDTSFSKLRITDDNGNFRTGYPSILNEDKFRRENDRGIGYYTREPQKYIYCTKLTADLTLGEMDYSFQEVDVVKIDHKLDRDVDIRTLRDDEHYITLSADYFYENREDDAKLLLMKHMRSILESRHTSARITMNAIDKLMKEEPLK